MHDPTFLFFGYGSEYSLHPLFEFMSQRGDRCVEINMLTEQDWLGRLQELANHPLIFVTSAHPLYDQHNFFYYESGRKVVSALQIISTLRPRLSVYYPHDYKDPVKEEEVPYLPLFDLLLWPFRKVPAQYRKLVAAVPVGWIKNVQGSQAEIDAGGLTVFFPGAYQYYLHAGVEIFYRDYGEMLSSNIGVKLPHWHENDRFERFLRDQGIVVYSSETNSIELMKSCDVVVTHALSSVALEACHLGKKVIYMLDGRFDYKDPLTEFRSAGNITFVNSPAVVAGMRDTGLVENNYIMMECNLEQMRDVILAEYRTRHGS